MVTETEANALVKIYEFSRRKHFRLGLSEEQVGVPHSVLNSLNLQKLVFSRSKFGKLYWSLTASGRQSAGRASRDQLPVETQTMIKETLQVACPDCKRLGIIPTTELIDKAKKIRETMGIYCCSEVEVHLLKCHERINV